MNLASRWLRFWLVIGGFAFLVLILAGMATAPETRHVTVPLAIGGLCVLALALLAVGLAWAFRPDVVVKEGEVASDA